MCPVAPVLRSELYIHLDSKLTYVWEQYLFHYISEGGFTYLVMADDAAGRFVFSFILSVLTQQFLQENALCIPGGPSTQGTSFTPHVVRRALTKSVSQFTSAPSSSSSDETPAYGLQGSFGPTISALMHTYNTAPPVDELARAQTELNQVKDIMVQNVEQILSRGERIELLVDKTDVMAGQATAFRRGARSVRREMWWRNSKILALSFLVGLVSVIPSPPRLSVPAFLIYIYKTDLPLDIHRTILWCWS